MSDEERDDPASEEAPQDDRPVPVRRVVGEFGAAVLSAECFRDEWTVVVERSRIMDVLSFLKSEPALAFRHLSDVTAVDCLELDDVRSRYSGARYMVVYHLYSHLDPVEGGLRRIRVKTPLPESNPSVASVAKLWQAANWAEREVFDLFGIHFEGHPDLRRILMPDSFEAHPLRKDYPLKGRGERASVDFEESPSRLVSDRGAKV